MKAALIFAVVLFLVLGWYLAQGSSFLQHRRGAFQNTDNPSTTGLLAWWALDDLSSPATWVDSHASFDLTKNGTVTSTTGNVAGGADFDKSTDYLANAAVSNTLHQSSFTAGCWVSLDASGVGEAVINQWGTTLATRHWMIDKTSGNSWRFIMKDSSDVNYDALSDSTVTDTNWHFVVGVRGDDDVLRLYIDGVLQADTHSVASITENTTDQDLWMGRNSNSYSDSQMDEAFVYTRALTEAEILWLYNSGSGRAYSDL
jgi:hypothetical protein